MSEHLLNRQRFNESLQSYLKACTETDWLTVGESYKFRFAKWLHDRVDFNRHTDEEILKICLDSQNEKYDGQTKGLNFLISSRRFGKEVIDIRDIKIIRHLFNGGELKKEIMTGTLPLTKFSVWLGTMIPEKFNTCPKVDLIHSLEYLFDEKGLPQKGFESFIIAQELLKIVRSEFHKEADNFKSLFSSFEVTKLGPTNTLQLIEIQFFTSEILVSVLISGLSRITIKLLLKRN